jgi:hypothetical protein
MGPTKKKRSAIETQLDALEAAAQAPSSAETRERISAALRTGPSLVAARAARIVRDHALDGFGDDLEAALRRFLVDPDPAKSDPGCLAKLAAAEALDYGEHPDAAPFLAATEHVQPEPAWGRPVDTAVGLRARGVLGLSRLGHPDLPIVAGKLLADPESPVRQAAADALAAGRERSSAGLLLLRWTLGDADPLVVMACMAGVLALAPDLALPRLRAALFGDDADAREAAAVVLAQSSRDDALDLMREHIEDAALPGDRAGTLRALGLHRTDRALDLALEVIAGGVPADAEAAIAGLAARRFEPGVRERAVEAARRNGAPRLEAALRVAFAST